jgi:hypothetical protein
MPPITPIQPALFSQRLADRCVRASQQFLLKNATHELATRNAELGLKWPSQDSSVHLPPSPLSPRPSSDGTISLTQLPSKIPSKTTGIMALADSANPLATPASRTAAIISKGLVECTFEGQVIEDQTEHAQFFTYGLCRLSDAHRRGEHHAHHLPAVHLVGGGSLGPHDRPFEEGEVLTLRVLHAAGRAASLTNSPSRRVLESSLANEQRNGARLHDAQADNTEDDEDGELRPAWELEGIGAIVQRILSRRHTVTSRRRLAHGATRCGQHNRCVGPRKLLTVGMMYTGERFCHGSSFAGAPQTAEGIRLSNFAPLGPTPPPSEWSPEPNFGWYDALSTRFDLM